VHADEPLEILERAHDFRAPDRDVLVARLVVDEADQVQAQRRHELELALQLAPVSPAP
jgi:hypothetical protein